MLNLPEAIRVDNLPENQTIDYIKYYYERGDRVFLIPSFSAPPTVLKGIQPNSVDKYESYLSGDYWHNGLRTDGGIGVQRGDISSALTRYFVTDNQIAKSIVDNYKVEGYELSRYIQANLEIWGIKASENLANSPTTLIYKYDKFLSDGKQSNANPPPSPNYVLYHSSLSFWTAELYVYQKIQLPTYYDLLGGFSKDKRTIPPSNVRVDLVEDTKIGYYKQNPLEPISSLKSIDWVEKTIIKGASVNLDLTGCVLGTLISDNTIQFPSTAVNQYSYTDFLYQNVDALFSKWRILANTSSSSNQLRLLAANNDIWNNNSIIYSDINYDPTHPLFSVDNQRAYDWHIKPQSDGSIGTLIMDSPRIIEIHAALEAAKYKAEVPAIIGTGTADNPQTPAIRTLGYSIANGGGQKLNDIHAALEAAKYKAEVPAVIGTGTADNPQTPAIHTLGYSIANGSGQKLTEIHKALDAGKYSKVEGSNIPRVATLGHLISKISAILGYRPEPDGSFTEDTEKKLVRKIVPSTEKIDKKKIGVNNFGSDGMLLRRLNNRFNGDKIANDECVIVKDLPQLLAEYQDQINLALGLQESSAVEIRNNSEVSRYSNQLAMLSELLNLASSNHDMIRAALISSLIAQGQTSETIAALGLPTVTKTLPIDVDGKITHLPYKGVAPHRSISQEVATCTQNVGIVLGQLL